MNALAEVEQHHAVLAAWLGTEADAEVLTRFEAAHAEDFTLIDIEGNVVGPAALTEALAGARNAVPGLVITISEFSLVAETAEVVVCRFLEAHSPGGSRRVTAVLRPDESARNGLRWVSVHETLLPSVRS